jgi:hypothetical protein
MSSDPSYLSATMTGSSVQVLVLLKLAEVENIPGRFGSVMSGLTPIFLTRRPDLLLGFPVSSAATCCEFPAVRARV